jgi:hypothetical protein
VLRAGEPQPVVHPGIQRGLSAGIDLWLFAGNVAVRAGRSSVVVRCAATLVAGRKIGLVVPGFAVGDEQATSLRHVFCLVFEKSEKLRTLAVEPAKDAGAPHPGLPPCRALTALVNEVTRCAIHTPAVVVKSGHSFHLCLPIEMILPVATALPHELEIDAIFPA